MKRFVIFPINAFERKYKMNITFGPVPSRRLGRSLGINNIPAKHCSYACIYCQLGNTLKMQVQRQKFFSPQEIFSRVKSHIEQVRQGEQIDYLAFVPDGEPTLDIHLGQAIEKLKSLGIPVAVITNASLMADENVRLDLAKADWVSLKVDSIEEHIWRQTDRPHGSLNLTAILEGMLRFREIFQGELVSETMLIKDVNDAEETGAAIALYLKKLNPKTAYLSIPTRPPAMPNVHPAEPDKLNQTFQLFFEAGLQPELLTGYEGDAFAGTGDVASDILSITSVHPMRREAVEKMVLRNDSSWEIIEQLVESGALTKTEFAGYTYYLRNFSHSNN